jgi:hypothetical protein
MSGLELKVDIQTDPQPTVDIFLLVAFIAGQGTAISPQGARLKHRVPSNTKDIEPWPRQRKFLLPNFHA